MFRQILVSSFVVTALAFAGCLQNGGGSMHDHMHMDHSAAIPVDTAGAVDLANTVCPVTGDKVGDSKEIAVYKGKIYHFCCSDCPKDFQKEPAKYAALVAADPAKYGVKK